jgi:U6 snRNA-associated Sm-like protein LSm1
VLEELHKKETEAKRARDEEKAHVLFVQKGFCKEGGEGDGY